MTGQSGARGPARGSGEDGTREIETLRRRLERRFRTTVTELHLGGRQLVLLHPASAEELLDEEAFERDERLPYWADLWPSARVLAAELLSADGSGRTLLELGCGAGLVATCAVLAGFAVTATDYYEDALRFTRVNVWSNTTRPVRVRMVDWRSMPRDLGRYDLVVASDVLYERPYGPLVAEAIHSVLAPTGEAIVADPGRVAAEDFLRRSEGLGLVLSGSDRRPVHDGPLRHDVTLYRLRPVGGSPSAG